VDQEGTWPSSGGWQRQEPGCITRPCVVLSHSWLQLLEELNPLATTATPPTSFLSDALLGNADVDDSSSGESGRPCIANSAPEGLRDPAATAAATKPSNGDPEASYALPLGACNEVVERTAVALCAREDVRSGRTQAELELGNRALRPAEALFWRCWVDAVVAAPVWGKHISVGRQRRNGNIGARAALCSLDVSRLKG